MKRILGAPLVVAFLLGVGFSVSAESEPLTTLNLNIVGIGLEVGPEYQAVPKGIATRVNTLDFRGHFRGRTKLCA